MASAKEDVSCLFTNPNFVTNLIKDSLTMTATANMRLVLTLGLESQVANSALLFAVSDARDLGQMTSALKMLAVDGKRAARQVAHAALLAAARNGRTGAPGDCPRATGALLQQSGAGEPRPAKDEECDKNYRAPQHPCP